MNKNIQNNQKGFIIPLVALIVALVVAGGVYVAVTPEKEIDVEIQEISNSTEETKNKVEVKNEMKIYVDTNLGLEFKYPAYFGNVTIKKTDRTSCPEMKTYRSAELLPSQDYRVTFSNMPKVGTGNSYVEATIQIAQTENNTNYCGLEISTLGAKMNSNSNYTKLNSGRPGVREEYVSNLFSMIGTEVSQYYSFFFAKRNQMILIQPNITFIPYSGSNEWKESNGGRDIVNVAKNNQSIQTYFRDFEALAASIKLKTDNNVVASPSTTDYKDSFGFGFSYPTEWSIKKESNSVTITTNDSDLGTITIKKIANSIVDDSTGKWGTYQIYFDQVKKQWTLTQSSEKSGGLVLSTITNPPTTVSGKPVFSGGIRSHGFGRYNYIVALDTTKFLVVSGGETTNVANAGYDPAKDKLLKFVRSITN